MLAEVEPGVGGRVGVDVGLHAPDRTEVGVADRADARRRADPRSRGSVGVSARRQRPYRTSAGQPRLEHRLVVEDVGAVDRRRLGEGRPRSRWSVAGSALPGDGDRRRRSAASRGGSARRHGRCPVEDERTVGVDRCRHAVRRATGGRWVRSSTRARSVRGRTRRRSRRATASTPRTRRRRATSPGRSRRDARCRERRPPVVDEVRRQRCVRRCSSPFPNPSRSGGDVVGDVDRVVVGAHGRPTRRRRRLRRRRAPAASGTATSPLGAARSVVLVPPGHGHSTRNDPSISPTIAAITRSWWWSSAQSSTDENSASPTTHPSRRAPRATTRSRSLTAPSTSVYMPISTRMNEPEMPGRIMAQIASAPDEEEHPPRLGDDLGRALGDLGVALAGRARGTARRPRPAIAPSSRRRPSGSGARRSSASPTTRPKNSAAIRIGWSCSRSSSTDDSDGDGDAAPRRAATAARPTRRRASVVTNAVERRR